MQFGASHHSPVGVPMVFVCVPAAFPSPLLPLPIAHQLPLPVTARARVNASHPSHPGNYGKGRGKYGKSVGKYGNGFGKCGKSVVKYGKVFGKYGNARLVFTPPSRRLDNRRPLLRPTPPSTPPPGHVSAGDDPGCPT